VRKSWGAVAFGAFPAGAEVAGAAGVAAVAFSEQTASDRQKAMPKVGSVRFEDFMIRFL
jgi:hypothetical protein